MLACYAGDCTDAKQKRSLTSISDIERGNSGQMNSEWASYRSTVEQMLDHPALRVRISKLERAEGNLLSIKV